MNSMSEWDISCSQCTTPDECRSRIKQHETDMVFISYSFDAKNGFLFLKQIRTIDSEVPVIILTARGDEHITAEIIRGGATDYIARDDLSSLRARRLIEESLQRLALNKERKLAETILRLNEQNYRILVDNIPDVVFVHRNGIIIFINQAVQSQLGYTEKEVVGKSVYIFIPREEDRMRVKQNMQLRIQGDFVPDYEINVCDKQGHFHTVIVRSSQTVFSDEPAFQVILIDITKRKKAEDELLKNRKLESLGILAGGIAHDFNNILTGIVSGIGVAKMKTGNQSDIAEILDEIEKAAFKASELTKELLTFSRGGEPVLKLCEIKSIIGEAAQLSAFATSISFDIIIPDNLLCVTIDKGQIGQVTSNLVLNAIQAMPSGGTITIRAANVHTGSSLNGIPENSKKIDDTLPLSDGLYIKVDISDTGLGISEANLEKIFDPFYTTKPAGTGLGLATVYSILQKHKGYITVDSTVGKGTTFSFYLPASLEKCPGKSEDSRKNTPGNVRILVMDDDEIILFTLEKLLLATGHDVHCVRDGTDALKAYKEASDMKKPFAAVLMDLTIPGGMGGKETVQKLLASFPDAKAIAISGYHNDPLIANYKNFGFCAALKKPFRPDELGELLQKITDSPSMK
jgi:PAS domain S-box-containing protein